MSDILNQIVALIIWPFTLVTKLLNITGLNND